MESIAQRHSLKDDQGMKYNHVMPCSPVPLKVVLDGDLKSIVRDLNKVNRRTLLQKNPSPNDSLSKTET